MKDRPIIFSGPMVQAILAGRKTMTRRVVKHDPFYGAPNWDNAFVDGSIHHKYLHVPQSGGKYGDATVQRCYCPFGQPGDRLWVRETFCPVDNSDFYCTNEPKVWVDYRATPRYEASHPAGWENDPDHPDALKWRPSIHMPRWASRITLEIVSVRVERVRDISGEDALAEGIDMSSWHDKHPTNCRAVFRNLWNSINAKRGYGWDSNPWVWVVEFKTVTAPADRAGNGEGSGS